MNSSTSCRSCGTCCRKGGPALLLKDKYLFEDNLLRVQDVWTIRKEELARDDSLGTLAPLSKELIKIAPAVNARPYDWTCRFLTSKNRCFLHGKHPAQCRALFCEDTKDLLALSGEEVMDRKLVCEITKAPSWWLELMQTHEEQVSYEKLIDLASLLEDDEHAKDAQEQFLQIVEYDRSFRDLCVEKAKIEPHILPFLFGRPILQTMIMFGLDARQNADGINIVRI